MPEALTMGFDTLLYLIAALLAGVGFVGCILPLPGMFFILGACVVASFANHDPAPAWWVWGVLTALAVAGTMADNVTTMLGAKKYGSSKAATWGALAGAAIGTCVLPFPLGLVVGPFLGALVTEVIIARKSTAAATKSGFGALLGTLAGMVAKIAIATAMLLFYYFAG